MGTDKDTVQIIATNDGLTAKPGKEIVPLKSAGDNLFFIQADKNMNILFTSEKNKVSGFWFLGDRKMLFRKL